MRLNAPTTVHCAEYAAVSRRDFLTNGLQAAFGSLASMITPLPRLTPRIALADPHVGPRGDTLVCIFLRGGADGLNIVVPHGDESYYAQRPTIAIPRPDDFSAHGRVLDLDGYFGLHPALRSLREIYTAGDLALVQATGSPDETRSHFEAMDLMERGAVEGEYSGWLARHLLTLNTQNESALRALSVGNQLPTSLGGALSATTLASIGDYHLHGREEHAEAMRDVLAQLYSQHDDLLAKSAVQTIAAMDVLRQLADEPYQAHGRGYPETEFGQALQTVGQLIRADVGVEVACVDLGGWDTHVGQGGAVGVMANQLTTLGETLTAFYEDMHAHLPRISLVVMSEFGRRVAENAGLGTDHGHGNMMMVMGGGIRGGQVFANWPGLHPDVQTGPGDLHITTDYRDILGELVRVRLKNPHMREVFGGYVVREVGLTKGG